MENKNKEIKGATRENNQPLENGANIIMHYVKKEKDNNDGNEKETKN